MTANPNPRAFALRMLAIAQGFVGVSRDSDQAQVEKFLRLFGLGFADPKTGKPYAYCAAGVSYAGCKALAEICGIPFTPANSVAVFQSLFHIMGSNYFLPSPRCTDMMEAAQKRSQWRDRTYAAEPGDLVLFDWAGDGKPDHVGLVAHWYPASLVTVEFNTSAASDGNGGAVAVRNREPRQVLGYIVL